MQCDHLHNNNRIFSLAVRSRGCTRTGPTFHTPVGFRTCSFFSRNGHLLAVRQLTIRNGGVDDVSEPMLWEFLWHLDPNQLAQLAILPPLTYVCAPASYHGWHSYLHVLGTVIEGKESWNFEILNVIKMATLGGRKAEKQPAKTLLVTMCSRISLAKGNGGAFQLQAIKGIQCMCFQ